jgi:phosphate acetyltransferase
METAEGKVFFFSDCAFVINPDVHELTYIALETATSARSFGINPKVAMLSFSTKGSAHDPLVNKVVNATKRVKELDPSLIVDGELQLDAAIVPEVAKMKCPNSPLEGNANILIFPDLNSGNIGYKLVQRLAGAKAIGPIVQGLTKPVNDLSRGCSVDDIVDVVSITVIEAQK